MSKDFKSRDFEILKWKVLSHLELIKNYEWHIHHVEFLTIFAIRPKTAIVKNIPALQIFESFLRPCSPQDKRTWQLIYFRKKSNLDIST